MLRPGEEKNIELIIKGNTRLESSASFSVDNDYDNKSNKFADLQFIPNTTSIPAGGGAAAGTSILDVKVLGNTKAATYTFPIIANISFPTSITNRGGETFNNTKSVSLLQTSNLTLTVLPSYTTEEHLNNFVNAWITPITGMWTFLAGVAAVLTPVIIRIYNKKQKRRKNEEKEQ